MGSRLIAISSDKASTPYFCTFTWQFHCFIVYVSTLKGLCAHFSLTKLMFSNHEIYSASAFRGLHSFSTFFITSSSYCWKLMLHSKVTHKNVIWLLTMISALFIVMLIILFYSALLFANMKPSDFDGNLVQSYSSLSIYEYSALLFFTSTAWCLLQSHWKSPYLPGIHPNHCLHIRGTKQWGFLRQYLILGLPLHCDFIFWSSEHSVGNPFGHDSL